MHFVEPIASFFEPGGFATPATLAGAVVSVILDTESEGFLGEVVTQGPSALLRSSEAAAAAPGQALVASGATYTVRQVLSEPPDGVLTRLVLARA
jgi:hypothetical protein